MSHEALEGVHADVPQLIMPAKELELSCGNIGVVSVQLHKTRLFSINGCEDLFSSKGRANVAISWGKARLGMIPLSRRQGLLVEF